MSHAIRIHQTGGPEVLCFERIPESPLKEGEVRLQQTWAGVNYVDVYHREGSYPLPFLPHGLGVEGAGRVIETGPGVHRLRRGDRVAYAGIPAGSYAEERVLSEHRLKKIPDGLSEESAAGAMLKGITAYMVLQSVGRVEKGQTVFIQAAAGGLGLILVQWARFLGAKTIGTVSSDHKAQEALALGLDHVINYKTEDFVEATMDFTQGRGVDLAIDGIGGEILLRTLDLVRPFGHIVSVGQVRGLTEPLDLLELGPRRSLTLSRPSSLRFISDAKSYDLATQALFEKMQTGLQIVSRHKYTLPEAPAAHRDLEAGKTSGSVLLQI